ncbi:MAG: PilN domain-containing protein [Candidatus Omnitrophica bacterium]|nr:PilN domain-containing protein [Candidatus Omnitrophota bacterium]
MKRINLIPPEAKKITPKRWLKVYIFKSRTTRLLSLAAIVFIFINLWQATSLLRYRFAINQGKKNIVKLQTKLTQSQNAYAQIKSQKQEIDKKSRRIEEKFKILQQTQGERIAWAKVLAHLSELVPQDLWIDKVTLNKDLVTLVGTTFDNAIVSRFMARLDESKYFQDTSFNYTQKAKLTDKPVINFEVTTHIVLEKAAR